MNVFKLSRANLLSGLKPATRFTALLMAALLLAACGGGGSSSGSSGGGASGVQVTNLKAIPGSGSLTLTWDNPNANISSFDVEVRNLATNERVVAASQVNRTISSNPAVNTTAPLATAGYTITGLVDDSNYSVAVTVNLQGADAGRATSARGLSGRRYLPTNGVRIGDNTDEDQYANAEDNCPAIKNDDQANTYGGADNIGDVCGDVDNDGTFDVNDNCAVVANTDQLDTNGNGMGDVCDSALNSDSDTFTNDLDNCPFIMNPNQKDGDGDNVGDICDVDDDGDGLIEISTAAELNMMRYNLAGTNLTITAGRAGNSMGCGGGMTVSGTAITTCNGYEQMVNIDLNDLEKNATGSNWEPIGSCTGTEVSNCFANAFTGEFNGNNYTINNLFINVSSSDTKFGIGLFGNAGDNAELSNINIVDATIDGNNDSNDGNLGILVGFAQGTTIINSAVSGNISGNMSNVGGLVGRMANSKIRFSKASIIGTISGTRQVGGLIGLVDGNTNILHYSYVEADHINTVATGENVGGLIGSASNLSITNSLALIKTIIIDRNSAGGLVGLAKNALIINSSLAIIGSISGDYFIGGILGQIEAISDVNIIYSLAVVNNITGSSEMAGDEAVGGLVGGGAVINIVDSYWDDKTKFTNKSGGADLMPRDENSYNQTTNALQTSDNSAGSIYKNWNDYMCSASEYPWSFDDSKYPELNCLPIDIGTQRDRINQLLQL